MCGRLAFTLLGHKNDVGFTIMTLTMALRWEL